MISNTITVMSAFSTEGGNMDCYADPDSVGGQLSMRWIIFLIVVFYSVYSTRTHQLNDFLQKDKDKRQQE